MVTHPLHDIPYHFGVEKRHGKFHQLDQEIGQDGNVDPCAHVQKYPGPDKLHYGTAEKEHELRHQDEIDEIDVTVLDTNIDHRLGEKRKDELQNTAGQQAQPQLEQQIFVGQNVPEQDTEAKSVASLTFQVVKCRRGINKQSNTRIVPVTPAVEPLF